jgi:DNA repair exonuclease SbcCD ATPase subunit
MAQDPQGVTPLTRRIDDELEQAITAAEDARDEAARLARELDQARALLAERDRELESFRADAQRRDAMVKALLREAEDRSKDSHLKDAVLAEELQVTIEELQASLEELRQVNEELEHRVAERTAGLRESEERFRRALEIETVGVIFFNRLRPSRWCKLGGGHQHRRSGRGQRGEGRFITGSHAGHRFQRQVTVL